MDHRGESERQIKSDLEELEQEGERMQERNEELDKEVREASEDFERKQQSPEVPGAQPDH